MYTKNICLGVSWVGPGLGDWQEGQDWWGKGKKRPFPNMVMQESSQMSWRVEYVTIRSFALGWLGLSHKKVMDRGQCPYCIFVEHIAYKIECHEERTHINKSIAQNG